MVCHSFIVFQQKRLRPFLFLHVRDAKVLLVLIQILEYSCNHTSSTLIQLALSSEALLWLMCWPRSWKICACFWPLSQIFVWYSTRRAASVDLSIPSVKWKSCFSWDYSILESIGFIPSCLFEAYIWPPSQHCYNNINSLKWVDLTDIKHEIQIEFTKQEQN